MPLLSVDGWKCANEMSVATNEQEKKWRWSNTHERARERRRVLATHKIEVLVGNLNKLCSKMDRFQESQVSEERAAAVGEAQEGFNIESMALGSFSRCREERTHLDGWLIVYDSDPLSLDPIWWRPGQQKKKRKEMMMFQSNFQTNEDSWKLNAFAWRKIYRKSIASSRPFCSSSRGREWKVSSLRNGEIIFKFFTKSFNRSERELDYLNFFFSLWIFLVFIIHSVDFASLSSSIQIPRKTISSRLSSSFCFYDKSSFHQHFVWRLCSS